MNLRGAILVVLLAAVAVAGLAAFLVASPGRVDVAEATDAKTISAKALSDHGCDSTEWHFVINQVRGEEYAPAHIVVRYSDGKEAIVILNKFTGKVAHYTTGLSLDSVVTQATARIYASWSGQFNLSHGPCTTPTTTPTPTVTSTPTPTETPTPTTTPSPTPTTTTTPTPTIIPTVPPTATSTFLPRALPDTGGTPPDEGVPLTVDDIKAFAVSDYAWLVGACLVGVALLAMAAYIGTRE